MRNLKRLLAALLLLVWLILPCAALAQPAGDVLTDGETALRLVYLDDEPVEIMVERDGLYTAPDEVALYLYAFCDLPDNFLTKADARALGWHAGDGNLWDVAPGMSIGGDRFGNREGLLPDARGRQYYECDVNYLGGYRGGERIVFSSDGLIYYTGDHYNTFTLMYEGWYDPDAAYGEEEWQW